MYEDSVAYICNVCSEAFAPENGDWPELKSIHRDECDSRSFTKTTVGKAF